MSNDDDPFDLKAIFRRQELERREYRNRVLLNQIKLQDEPLTQEEKMMDKTLRGNIWKRLWKAIRNT